eukprot:361817-Chlamydomonas_euryale.AAC.3
MDGGASVGGGGCLWVASGRTFQMWGWGVKGEEGGAGWRSVSEWGCLGAATESTLFSSCVKGHATKIERCPLSVRTQAAEAVSVSFQHHSIAGVRRVCFFVTCSERRAIVFVAVCAVYFFLKCSERRAILFLAPCGVHLQFDALEQLTDVAFNCFEQL